VPDEPRHRHPAIGADQSQESRWAVSPEPAPPDFYALKYVLT